MELVKVNELKSHPRNKEFFDDIVGDNWEQFLESVRQNGVIEPIVITQDKMIVSGHQRVRSCIELGIETIHARIKLYSENVERKLSLEDVVLEELILTNLRQRGIGNPNAMKMGRCIVELERINGIMRGNNQHKDVGSPTSKTQKDLADEIGINKDTLVNYKKLTKLIPELQELTSDGKITAKVGQTIFSKMNEEEQRKMLNAIGKDKLSKMNTDQVKQTVDIIKDNEKENIETIKEIIKVIPPDDYEEMKKYIKLYENEVEEKKKELHKATLLIQDMRASNENIAKAESKRKDLDKQIRQAEGELNDINKLYGDATNTLKKQRQLNELIDKHKDVMKLMESKFTGFKPHKMGEDNFKAIIQEYKDCLYSAITFVEDLEGKTKYIEVEEI